MKDLIEQMCKVRNEKCVWSTDRKSGESLRRGITNLNSQTSSLSTSRTNITRGSASLKWAGSSAVMGGSEVDLNSGESSPRGTHRATDTFEELVPDNPIAFLCCSRDDAIADARVLSAELSIKLDQGIALGGGADTAQHVASCPTFILLLTTHVLLDTNALFEIWTALQHQLRIVTIVISGSGYDFHRAAEILGDLETSLEQAGLGRAARLLRRMPAGTSLNTVGEQLHACLTAIIALPWAPAASKNQTEATISEIVSRMPTPGKKKLVSIRRYQLATRRYSGRHGNEGTASPTNAVEYEAQPSNV